MKKIFSILIIVLFLHACAPQNVSTVEPILTSTPTLPAPSNTELPTSTSTPTETPDPLTGAPEGTTGKDKSGNYIKILEENGYTYEYKWDAERENWVINLGKFFLWDSSKFNYLPVFVVMDSEVLGGENLVSITQHDATTSNESNKPLTTTTRALIFDRYFEAIGQERSEANSIEFQEEMKKGVNSNALIPLTTSSGENIEMRLSTETGFIIMIVPVEDLKPLVGNGSSLWLGLNNTFFSRVTGVDINGSVICEVASDIPINDLSDEQIRLMLFSCIGNVLTNEDQTIQGNTPDGQVLAQNSGKLKNDGTPDVVINRAP